MRFTFPSLPCVFLSICLGSCSVCAAIVLDDFDDLAETASPAMLLGTISTDNVGDLSATRELRIAASTAGGESSPIASFDAGVTVLGAMTANLQKVGNIRGGGKPLFAFQFNYVFSPTDVSKGGANDAVLFDFRSINGTEPPIFLRTIVTDDTSQTSRFEARIYNPPSSSSAFTIAMPFSSFTVRGGSPGLPDFTTFKRMDFDFFFLRPSLDIQWSAQLERIRFGRIPEPSSLLLALGGVLMMVCRRFSFHALFVACFVLLACPSSAHAGIILDDFDDSAETASPAMLLDTISTDNVGDLSATRELRIAASTSGVRASIASLDTGVTTSGVMTANIQKVGSTQGGGKPLFAFQFNYIFPPSDVSQGGANDAVLLDFRSINGTEVPLELGVIVTDDTSRVSRYMARIHNLPTNSDSFTVAMPFSSFTVRGGSPGLPDFTTLKRMDFDFFFLRPSLDIQWSAQLERIRFGRIPEPSSQCLFLFGVLYFTGRHRPCRCSGLPQPTGG